MHNPFSKFRKAKGTILALGICFLITGAVSFHNNILIPHQGTTESLTSGSAPSGTVSRASIDGSNSSRTWWELAEKVLMTFCVVLIVHLFDKTYLMDEVIENTKSVLKKVVGQHINLIGAADECGIAEIYPNRLAARDYITGDIENANSRIWMLGVGLNVRINAKEMFSELRDKKKQGVDVRILMLDAFRSTAVFRTFLESSPDQVARIIKYYERLCADSVSDPETRNAYFSATLCSEFESTCRALDRTPELAPNVKFYAHTPTCWLVITDNRAYFQPYTFGKGVRQHKERQNDIHRTATGDETIGDFMPVFRFHSYKNTDTFGTIEDHFLKLWATSDCSVLHMRERQNNKDVILKKIFETRMEWLRNVYNMLHTKRGKESYAKRPGEIVSNGSKKTAYRLYQRQICPMPVKVFFTFKENENREFTGRIVDSSKNGLAILTNGEFDGPKDRLIGSEVEIRLDTTDGDRAALPDLTYSLSQVFLAEKNRFVIKNAGEQVPVRIGLRKIA